MFTECLENESELEETYEKTILGFVAHAIGVGNSDILRSKVKATYSNKIDGDIPPRNVSKSDAYPAAIDR